MTQYNFRVACILKLDTYGVSAGFSLPGCSSLAQAFWSIIVVP